MVTKYPRLALAGGALFAICVGLLLLVHSQDEGQKRIEAQKEWRSTIDDIVSLSLVGRWNEEPFEPEELKVAIAALRNARLVGKGEYHGTGQWMLKAASHDGTTTRWLILDDGEKTFVYVDGYEMRAHGLSGVIDSVSTRMRH